MEQVVATLKTLQVGYLVTIGGDDTMYAASQVAKFSAGRIRVCHVPKTIDNDLPLPGEMPTFGYETARQQWFRNRSQLDGGFPHHPSMVLCCGHGNEPQGI